jgi:hypothetical protein
MDIGCNRMATVARDLYSRCGWRCDRRLACWCRNIYLFIFCLDGWFLWRHCVTLEL